MIRVSDLTARTAAGPRVEVGPASFALDAGTATALVGTPQDGVDLVLAVLAGATAPRKGVALVADVAASSRATVAYVPLAPDLPGVLLVRDYLELASRVRGEPREPARDRLAVLGVEPLADRRIGQLTLEEVRAVALVEALTSRARFLFVAEPLADVDPRAVGRVGDALQARVDAGATAVFSTASRADARALAGELLFFSLGKLTLRMSAADAWSPPLGAGPGAARARLRIRSEGARYLLAELAADPTFDEIHAEGAELVVAGRDPVAMAAAVAGATRHANVELDLLTFVSVVAGEGDA